MSVRRDERLAFNLTVLFFLVILDASIFANGFAKPKQCGNYRNLTEKNRNVNNSATRIPQCDTTLRDGWYRFSGQAGNILTVKSVTTGKCGAQSPGMIQGDHPCVKYETTDAQVCFVNIMGQCGSQVNVSITLCGEYYVYQLPRIKNCSTKRRYCGEDSTMPLPSCNITSLHGYPTMSRKVHTSTIEPDWSSTSQSRATRNDLPTTHLATTHLSTSHLPTSLAKDIFGDLKEQVEELGRMPNTSREVQRRVAREIINTLSNLTDLDKMDKEQQENGLKQKNIIDTVAILQKIVELHISDGSFNIFVPANNILDRRNINAWKRIQDSIRRDLVTTLEKYGFQQGKNIQQNQNISINFVSVLNYSNVHLHVKYVKKPASLSPEDRSFKLPGASFELSPDAIPEGQSNLVVVVMWYRTLHLLMSNSFYNIDEKRVNAEVKSNIIIASVRPEPKMTFKEPVRFIWDMENLNGSEVCVYWKPELNENIWKTNGCRRINASRDSNRLVCECDHLTAFAAMDISRNMVSKSERQALELISTVGCSLSLIGIILTILTHALLWRRLQQNTKSRVPSQVLMHLCVAIGMIDILAILAGPAQNHHKSCIALSILLYFFVLAVFGWMFCEGIVIYLQLVNVYTGLGMGGRHLKVFHLIGWGIPVVVVGVLVGVSDLEDFVTTHACWCRAGGMLFWVFVGTISVILLINLVIFILALRSALSSSEVNTTRTLNTTAGSTSSTETTVGSTAVRKAKIGLKGSAILLPLLGLTWTFGLLVFNRDTVVFKYLFAICNSLQGLMIFVFHVLINRKVHEAINKEKKARRVQHINVIMANNNTCRTLPTSDTPRKSSLAVTPIFSKKFDDNSLEKFSAPKEKVSTLTPNTTCRSIPNRPASEDLKLRVR